MTNNTFQIQDIEDTKVYKSMVKEFGDEETREFFKKSETDLRAVLAEGQVQKTEAKQALDENENFAQAKAVCKVMRKGLSDAVKPINIRVNAASFVLAYMNASKKAK